MIRSGVRAAATVVGGGGAAAGATREARITHALSAALQPTALLVEDLSGGCDGGTLRVTVESPRFRGLNIVAQHRLVNATLGDELKAFHAVVVKTTVSKQ